MKNYKIGYYYRNRLMYNEEHHNNRLVVSFVTDHLEFKFINSNIWPHFYEQLEYSMYKHNLPCKFNYFTYKYDCLDYPVIYTEDEKGVVQDLFFLNDIPLNRKAQNLEGFFVSEPHKYTETTFLFFDGENVFPSLIDETSNEFLFYNTVLNRFAFQRKVDFLKKESEPACESYFYQYVKDINEYLDSINLEEIISDLKIIIDDWHHVKLGDNDTYGIDRTVSVSNPIANKDGYLKQLIHLGRKNIYYNCGFAPWHTLRDEASDFLEKHPLGEYNKELLEQEKQKIVSNYSREDHFVHLFVKRLVERDKNKLELPFWEEKLKETTELLNNKFHCNELWKINTFDCRNSLYGFNTSLNYLNNDPNALNNYIKRLTICQ